MCVYFQAVCQGVSEEDISADLMQGCERAVVAEIFSSVCAEVRDEVCAVCTVEFVRYDIGEGFGRLRLSARVKSRNGLELQCSGS